MKRLMVSIGILSITGLGLFVLAGQVSAEEPSPAHMDVTQTTQSEVIASSGAAESTCSTPIEAKASSSFICRCLDEPGNTSWAKKNEVKCDRAISKAIGVKNWKRVNLSKPPYKRKWNALLARCP